MFVILSVVDMLFNLLWWLIFVQFVLSWLFMFNILDPNAEPVGSIWRAFETVLEPIYRPIRRILPNTGALDLSPMVVLIAMAVIDQALIEPALANRMVGA